MRRMVKENLLKFDGTPLFPERRAYTVPYKLSDAEAQLYKQSPTTSARSSTAPKRWRTTAGGHGRLRAHHPPTPARVVAGGDLPVAASPPRAAGEPAARTGETPSSGPGRPASRPFPLRRRRRRRPGRCSGQRDRGGRREILDQATAARTIAELKVEIATLKGLEKPRSSAAGTDRKWGELARLLGRSSPSPARSRTDGPPRCRRRPAAQPSPPRSSSSSPSTATR